MGVLLGSMDIAHTLLSMLADHGQGDSYERDC